MAKPGSYEDLQDRILGAGASSTGGLPPGTDRAAFHADARLLSRKLQQMNAGLIDPYGKFMNYWDGVILLAMVYTTSVTPLEIAFIRNPSVNLLFAFNQVVNLIFVLDLVLNFFMPYKEPLLKGGQTVRSHALIARHYLRGWFFVDFVSIIPFDIMDAAGAFNAPSMSGEEARRQRTVVRRLRLFRLLKLLKLARLLRASRVIQRFENRQAMTFTAKQGWFYIVVIIVTLHWLACLWAMLATFSQYDPRTAELADAVAARMAVDSSCTGCDDIESGVAECMQDCLTVCEREELAIIDGTSESYVNNRQHWMCRATDGGVLTPEWDTIGEVWLTCMVVALGQLSGGSITIAPQNPAENTVFFFGLLMGSVIWAIVQGVVCGVITTGDPHYIEHRQNLDQLNFLMEDMQIEPHLRARVRDYFKHTLSLGKRRSFKDNLSLLSPMLKTDVALRMGAWVVRSVEWLQGCEPDFLRDVFECMEREAFAVKEKLHADRLNVLNVGVVARGGKILMPEADRGPVWGDLLLAAPALRNMSPARALTYVEVTVLSREHLEECMGRYPESAALIRQTAMRYALVKVTELIDRQIRRKRQRRELAEQTAEERRRREGMTMMARAMGGGGGDDDGGAEAEEEPDEVLRMICGVGGMRYRELALLAGRASFVMLL